MNLAERIYTLRTERGLSQLELNKLLYATLITEDYSDWVFTPES